MNIDIDIDIDLNIEIDLEPIKDHFDRHIYVLTNT